jgi:hypothetical protein
MKNRLCLALAALALSSAISAKADDIVIYRRSVNLSGTETVEQTAPNVVGLAPFTGRLTEVQYEIIDLTNQQHVIIEVYTVDPLTGAKGYLRNAVAAGLGYSVLAGHPAGTSVWFNGKVFREETSGEQTSTLIELYEEFGRAAPTRVGTKTLVVPTTITVARDGMDQYSNSAESRRGSVTLAGTGSARLDTRLSASLDPAGDLNAAVTAVTTLLQGQGFVDLEP